LLFSLSIASLILYGINIEIENNLSTNLYDQNVILVPLNAIFCLIWIFLWALIEIKLQPNPDGFFFSDESSKYCITARAIGLIFSILCLSFGVIKTISLGFLLNEDRIYSL
jgi:hypothetical protein